MPTTPVEFWQSCVLFIMGLPWEGREAKALWLLDKMKEGRGGRFFLSGLQRQYFIRCGEARLNYANG